jgi:Asp-tRNA(Asn)/Glu-tRNA(Gln) amidotransferase A subunit family amidase
MSLKDQFNVEGLDSTLGYVGRAFAPADADAIIVSILKSLGAVIVAKTNLPQSIMVTFPTLSLIMSSLTDGNVFIVVRNGESSVGTDDPSAQS